MTVSSRHPTYDENVPKWELVRDVLKSNILKHIKDIDVNDPSRNKRYKDDAQFTNFTARTVSGLVGAVFRKKTIIQMPSSLEYMMTDATGDELPIEKLAQELVRETLSLGRYGLLVDFPSLPGGESISAAQAEALNLRASILKYSPESIINWHITKVGAKNLLDLVVLKEHIDEIDPEDGFEWKERTQFRVLRLVPTEDGQLQYIQQIYNEDEELVSTSIPRDKQGQVLNEIPFVFIGSNDNDSKIDWAPMYDLARLNIGHLRNSADYEESVHIVGQPTLFLTSSMDAESFKAANPDGVYIGARKGVNLGETGKAEFLQANPNQLADKAMERKEMQAVMMGARLIVAQADRETAEAARMRHSGETSILNTIASNVEAAIVKCLNLALEFMSDNIEADSKTIVFNINDIFFDPKIDPNFLMAQIQLVENRAISMVDFRKKLRKLGVIESDKTDAQIDAELGPESKEDDNQLNNQDDNLEMDD